MVFAALGGGLTATLREMLRETPVPALGIFAAGAALLCWLAVLARRARGNRARTAATCLSLAAIAWGAALPAVSFPLSGLLLGLALAPALWLTARWKPEAAGATSVTTPSTATKSAPASGGFRPQTASTRIAPSPATPVPASLLPSEPRPLKLETLPLRIAGDFDEGAESVTQTWTRSSGVDGDRMEGAVRVVFHAGERLRYVHVPCLPPFAGAPQVWCECDTNEFTAECDTVRPFGIRLSVRRRPLAAEAAVSISVVLAVPPSEARAA